MKTALVIDDDGIWLEIISKIIKNSGYQVLTARDGLEGLYKALNDRPDVIVVDHLLPKINGAYIIRFLRKNPDFSKSGIVLITFYEDVMNEYWAYEYGADLFIRKSEGIESIKKKLSEFLKGEFYTVKTFDGNPVVSMEMLAGILDEELRHEKINRDVLGMVEHVDDEEYVVRKMWETFKKFGKLRSLYIMLLTPSIGRLYAFSDFREVVNVHELRSYMLSLMKKPVTPSEWIFRGNIKASEDSQAVDVSMVFPIEFRNTDLGILALECFETNEKKIFLTMHKDIKNSLGILAHTLNIIWEYRIASTVDSLTGLFVKKVILEKLQDQMKLSLRKGMEFSIAMADIDDFKKINDTYGHVVGDQVLRILGQMIRDNIREVDSAGRYGGEEFLLIFPGTNMEGAETVVRRILDSLRNADWKKLAGVERITMSVGIVQGDPRVPMTELINRADKALYEAKRSGKDRYVVYGGGSFESRIR